MGCDIHEFVEYVRGDKWVRASDNRGHVCFYCKGTGKWRHDGGTQEHSCFCKGKQMWHINRNYLFFGLLAGVRFQDFDYVRPRGLPKDVSNSIKKYFYEGDDHSASYFTLTELYKMAEKEQYANDVVNIKQYCEIQKQGYTSSWNDIWVPNKELISNKEMAKRSKLISFLNNEQFFTKITWKQPNRIINPDFWENFIPAMAKLHKDPNKVRFVFWFDN